MTGDSGNYLRNLHWHWHFPKKLSVMLLGLPIPFVIFIVNLEQPPEL
jgi:hypothetical protein